MDQPFDAARVTVRWNSERETTIDALHELAPTCDYDGRKLARLFNVSPRQLQRMFSATFSRSPQAWLNERRLHTARQMLETADSVKEVAHSLGFRRVSQFSRDFRRLFGLTPSQALSDRRGASRALGAGREPESRRGDSLRAAARAATRRREALSLAKLEPAIEARGGYLLHEAAGAAQAAPELAQRVRQRLLRNAELAR
jgi:AraC-like DNA-binding protein